KWFAGITRIGFLTKPALVFFSAKIGAHHFMPVFLERVARRDDGMEFTQYNRRANAFTGMETAAVDRFGGKFDANQHGMSLPFRRRVSGFSSAGRLGNSDRKRRQGNRS